MSVTIEEVAARANLNKGSVSRILNGKGDGYSDQTKQRVLQTAHEMGYQPNPLARALWTGQTHIVALWLLSHTYYSPYYGYIHHCLQRLVQRDSYQLITEDVGTYEVEEAKHLDLVRWPADGILSCDVTQAAAAHRRSMAGRRCPIVCLGQGTIPDADYVSVDLYAGAKEAIEHLLSTGCQRVAFVSQNHTFTGSLEVYPRAHAYVDLLGEAGKATEYVAVPEDSRQGAYTAFKEYIERHGCPDGLFCVNDEIAIGCYLALQDLGIRVPDDVSIVGFNGLENARFFPCPLSSVVIPVEEMCALAWDMLMQRIQNPWGTITTASFSAPLRSQSLFAPLKIGVQKQRHRSSLRRNT